MGRSRAFWHCFYPILQQTFPQQLGTVPLDLFYAAINRASPSLIRVEADELTYNLHIMLRVEIEQALIENRVQPDDLPELWNEKMQSYLGIVPEQDAEGVLQDVHWSMGAFGYFPTYTLGNLYAVQFFEQAKQIASVGRTHRSRAARATPTMAGTKNSPLGTHVHPGPSCPARDGQRSQSGTISALSGGQISRALPVMREKSPCVDCRERTSLDLLAHDSQPSDTPRAITGRFSSRDIFENHDSLQ